MTPETGIIFCRLPQKANKTRKERFLNNKRHSQLPPEVPQENNGVELRVIRPMKNMVYDGLRSSTRNKNKDSVSRQASRMFYVQQETKHNVIWHSFATNSSKLPSPSHITKPAVSQVFITTETVLPFAKNYTRNMLSHRHQHKPTHLSQNTLIST